VGRKKTTTKKYTQRKGGAVGALRTKKRTSLALTPDLISFRAEKEGGGVQGAAEKEKRRGCQMKAAASRTLSGEKEEGMG